ncbi:MAG: hypothetical protein ACRC6V_03155 [Bacteroidales bacterium]
MLKRLGYVVAMSLPVLFTIFSVIAFVVLSLEGDVESTRSLQWWVFGGIAISVAAHKISVWVGKGTVPR